MSDFVSFNHVSRYNSVIWKLEYNQTNHLFIIDKAVYARKRLTIYVSHATPITYPFSVAGMEPTVHRQPQIAVPSPTTFPRSRRREEMQYLCPVRHPVLWCTLTFSATPQPPRSTPSKKNADMDGHKVARSPSGVGSPILGPSRSIEGPVRVAENLKLQSIPVTPGMSSASRYTSATERLSKLIILRKKFKVRCKYAALILRFSFYLTIELTGRNVCLRNANLWQKQMSVFFPCRTHVEAKTGNSLLFFFK